MSSVNVGDGLAYRMKNAALTSLTFRAGLRFNLSKKGCCHVTKCHVPKHHTSCGDQHVQH